MFLFGVCSEHHSHLPHVSYLVRSLLTSRLVQCISPAIKMTSNAGSPSVVYFSLSNSTGLRFASMCPTCWGHSAKYASFSGSATQNTNLCRKRVQVRWTLSNGKDMAKPEGETTQTLVRAVSVLFTKHSDLHFVPETFSRAFCSTLATSRRSKSQERLSKYVLIFFYSILSLLGNLPSEIDGSANTLP